MNTELGSFVKICERNTIYTEVWFQGDETVIVWMTMVLLADWGGVVLGDEASIIEKAKVSADGCRKAIKWLEETEDEQMQRKSRLEKIEGGWRIPKFVEEWRFRSKKRLTASQRRYQEYLGSEHWEKLRESALERDGRKCAECGKKKRLQVHHKVYQKRWEDGKLEDVETLCSSCHRGKHR